MSKKGFTLIEVMIVIAICGILFSVAAPAIMAKLEKTEGSTTISSGSTSPSNGTVIFNN